jgi:hypothetical protein
VPFGWRVLTQQTSLAEFWIWGIDRDQDMPLINKFGVVEAYGRRKIHENEIEQRVALYSADARLMREHAEKISTPNRISRTRRGPKGHTRELRVLRFE